MEVEASDSEQLILQLGVNFPPIRNVYLEYINDTDNRIAVVVLSTNDDAFSRSEYEINVDDTYMWGLLGRAIGERYYVMLLV